MKKQDLIEALRSVDEAGATELSERYHGIPDSEHERLLGRIEARVRTQSITEEFPEDAPITVQEHRFSWLNHAVTAAACVLLFVGAFAGVFWMKSHAPLRPEEAVNSVSPSLAPVAYAMGETYAAGNLATRGWLQMTVQNADYSEETGLYEVTIELTSEEAWARDDSHIFLADNFLVAVGKQGEFWDTVSPCAIRGTEAEAYPYAFRMEPGQTRTITLSYDLNGQTPRALVTTRKAHLSYTKLTEE